MREISFRTYAVAFVISAFLFGTGIMAGLYISQGVASNIYNELSDVRTRTAELELLSLMGNSSQLCSVYHRQLADFDAQTAEIDRQVDILGKSRGSGDADYQRLKREFTLMQLRDYLLVQRINSGCMDKIDTILFFYSNDGCPDCAAQGEVGPMVKKSHPTARIYAFDTGVDSPVLAALQGNFGVTRLPALVVNGNTLLGLQAQAKVESLLAR